ncbi:MAG: hypothetical protein BWY76_01740 [bacterium ADurb.Bin429]|nr:MAG: hypothetical protein BWY76_01740 [bacterium ADurb.Bin429]
MTPFDQLLQSRFGFVVTGLAAPPLLALRGEFRPVARRPEEDFQHIGIRRAQLPRYTGIVLRAGLDRAGGVADADGEVVVGDAAVVGSGIRARRRFQHSFRADAPLAGRGKGDGKFDGGARSQLHRHGRQHRAVVQFVYQRQRQRARRRRRVQIKHAHSRRAFGARFVDEFVHLHASKDGAFRHARHRQAMVAQHRQVGVVRPAHHAAHRSQVIGAFQDEVEGDISRAAVYRQQRQIQRARG